MQAPALWDQGRRKLFINAWNKERSQKKRSSTAVCGGASGTELVERLAIIITKSDVSTILGERFFLSNAFSSIIPVIYPLVFCEGICLLYILVRAGASLIQVRVLLSKKWINVCTLAAGQKKERHMS